MRKRFNFEEARLKFKNLGPVLGRHGHGRVLQTVNDVRPGGGIPWQLAKFSLSHILKFSLQNLI